MQASLNHQQAVSSEPFGQTGVRQYIFAALASASLILMVLSVGMWLRSHYQVDTIARERDETSMLVRSIYGRILIAWGQHAPGFALDREWTYTQSPIPEPLIDAWGDSIPKRLGLEWRRQPLNAYWGVRGGWIRIRWPLLVVISGILPAIRVVREHQRRRWLMRLQRGQCPRCGCDIRSSPQCCPNCGAVPMIIDPPA